MTAGEHKGATKRFAGGLVRGMGLRYPVGDNRRRGFSHAGE